MADDCAGGGDRAASSMASGSGGGGAPPGSCDFGGHVISSDASGGGADGATTLLELPDHLLLEVLALTDRAALCSASRACRRLCAKAERPELWPGFSDDGPVLRRVRRAMAEALRIPPQAFACHLDLKRSRHFPVCAPTYSLRPLLRTPDPEALASAASRALQDRAERAAPRLWQLPSPRAWPAVAVVAVCRSDRACVRFGLRPAAAVAAVADEIALMGWPPQQCDGDGGGGGGLAPCSCGDSPGDVGPQDGGGGNGDSGTAEGEAWLAAGPREGPCGGAEAAFQDDRLELAVLE
ncbi:hypothetical protein MNEG_11835, partial [Monoraphidium neglectum]